MVEADVDERPIIKSTGPATPPTRMAAASHGRSARDRRLGSMFPRNAVDDPEGVEPQSRTKVEKPRQQPGIERPQQQLGQRRARTEEDGGG